MEKELLTCPWCGEQMRFDADSVHCWYKCDNCFSISPKARRLWDDGKSNKENWDINKAKALFLIERSNAKSSRWISVVERLPEAHADGSVDAELVTDGEFIHMAYYAHGQWIFCESGEMKGPMWNTVTHWMPLPEPPKEDSAC